MPDALDLPALYAAWKAAKDARARAEPGSPAYLSAAKEAARVKAEARELTGRHDPFVYLETAAANFHAPFGTGRRE